MSRKIAVTFVVVALLLLATPVLAGGWLTVTVDSLPEGVRAGEEVQIGFMVRQHGVHPNSNVSPFVTLSRVGTKETTEVQASATKVEGHFVAMLNFPAEGEWEWSITIPEFNHTAKLAPLTVLPAVEAAPADAGTTIPPSASRASIAQMVLRWSGIMLLVVAALLVILDVRRRPAPSVSQGGD